MIQTLDIKLFLEYATQHRIPVLDVRAPKEFTAGHVPGALSLPLFTDEERKQVGTTYKQVSKDQAVLLGLDLFGPKMSDMVRQAEKIAPAKEVMLHCWRGGMRSASVAWLLDLAGFKVHLLQDGYKAFRRFIHQSFELPYKMVVVGGLTGSGKTELLQELAQHKEQVIDLEKLASHKGSSFGSIGQEKQPSIEQFENELGLALLPLDLNRSIWLEDENITIGRVNLPKPLYDQMQQSLLIKLEIPKEARIRKLTQEYQHTDKTLLHHAISRIKKRLGGLAYKEATEAIDAGDIQRMVELTLVYYDKAYSYQLNNKPPDRIIPATLFGTDPKVNVRTILDIAKNIY